MDISKPRSESSERGFALTEVLVAILIIGAALLTLLAASASSFGLQELARQRQAATGIANEVMERVRTLNFSDIRLGAAPSTGSTFVASCAGVDRLIQCTRGEGLGEKILVNTSLTSSGCPDALAADASWGTSPLGPNCSRYVLNGVEYRAYVFVTKESALPYRVTVIVSWGGDRSAILQTMISAPKGCLGTLSDSLVVGPCGTPTLVNATVPGIQATVSAIDTSGSTKYLGINLGGLTVGWDEPIPGQRALSAAVSWPAFVASGTPVDLAAKGFSGGSSMSVATSNSAGGTPAGSSSGSYVKAGTVLTDASPLVLATANFTQNSVNYRLILRWRAGAPGCSSDALACAQIDEQADALGGTCVVSSSTLSSPCVGAAMSLPRLDICLKIGVTVTSNDVCGASDPVLLTIGGTLGAGSLLATFSDTATARTRSVSRTLGVGTACVDVLAPSGAGLSCPGYPLLKTGLSESLSYDPDTLLLNGATLVPNSNPYMNLKIVTAGPDKTPSDCSWTFNTSVDGAIVYYTSDTSVPKCYMSNTYNAYALSGVPAGSSLPSASMIWSWWTCTAKPGTGGRSASVFSSDGNCAKKVEVGIDLQFRTSLLTVASGGAGSGW